MNRFMFFSRSGATTVTALSPVFMSTMTRKSKTILKIVGSIGQFDQQQQAAADYSVKLSSVQRQRHNIKYHDQRQLQQRYGYLHVNNNNNNTFYQPNIKIVHSVSTFSTSSKSSLKSSSKLKEKEPVDEINAINLPLTSSSAPSSTTTISSSINLKSSNSKQ